MVKKWRSRLLAQSDNFEGTDEEIKRLGILRVNVNNEPTLLIKRPNIDDQWERIEPGDFIVSYDGKTWQRKIRLISPGTTNKLMNQEANNHS